ncbi:hypothetical protein [Prochlorococcus sp. MIT 1300]|uniref:glycosyltransferase family 2 protein n=1 Tax=Prochlorococcus sp. MIT 1300 TaxID=3096218 RepID=UPI002A75B2FA|nr:hypothetical protein [Prochlorococcus sp. MIT 1300]
MEKNIYSIQQKLEELSSNSLLGEGCLITEGNLYSENQLDDRYPDYQNSPDFWHAFNKTHYHLVSLKDAYQLVEGKSQLFSASGVSSLLYDCGGLIKTINQYKTKFKVNIAFISKEAKIKVSNPIWDLMLLDQIGTLSMDNIDKFKFHRILNKDSISQFISLGKNRLVQDLKTSQRSFIIIDPIIEKDERDLIAAHLYSLMPWNIVISIGDHILFDENEKKVEKELKVMDSSVTLGGSGGMAHLSSSVLWKHKVTAVINLYRRPECAVKIYDALLQQSYPISKIIIWVNSYKDKNEIEKIKRRMPLAKFVISDENLGVWARFSYSLNNLTEYTVVFDDDTVPGNRWIENCCWEMSKVEALYGTVGLIYQSSTSYMDHIRYGWPLPIENAKQVDIVGHSWFFKTNWLKTYWRYKEDVAGIDFCGEDMHFSYALQQKGIPTMVPPHPLNDKALWGSIQALEEGSGSEAISISGKGSMMDQPFRRLIQRGFKLIKNP